MLYSPIPPMEQDEHRAVVRSLVMKFACSFVVAFVLMVLSANDYIRLDVLSTGVLGFFLFFCVGDKFFPESTKFIGRRARNYRRSKKGLEPLDLDDEPSAEINSDFQRKS
jgi:hypothetical protein